MEKLTNNILICKYRKSAVVCRDKFVLFIGDDVGSRQCRIPPHRHNEYVHSSHIADYGEYLYIPDDIRPRDENGYTYNKPICSQYLPKWKWLEIKRTHPYEGGKLDEVCDMW